MKLNKQLTGLVLAFSLILFGVCFAENEQYLGIQWGLHSVDPDFNGFDVPVDQAIGARYLFLRVPLQVSFSGNYYFFGDDPGLSERLFDLNLDVLYSFNFKSMIPYGGAGLNITRYSAEGRDIGDIMVEASFSNTAPALSLVGGAQFRLPDSRILPFAEFRYIFNSKIAPSDEWVGINRRVFTAGVLLRTGPK